MHRSVQDYPNWDDIRSDFKLDSAFVHLVGFWLSTHSRAVRDAIDRHRIGLDLNPYLYLRDHEEGYDKAVRTALARFLGADSADSIVLTESTTTGLSIILSGIALPQSAQVVTTEHEHYSAWKIAELFARRNKVSLKRIGLYSAGHNLDQKTIIDSVLSNISQDSILILTWVHSDTGVLLPIEAICSEIRKRFGHKQSPLVVVDATHAIGAVPLRLRESFCDIVVASCHKWLLGPRGTAFIWGNKDTLKRIDAWAPSFSQAAIATFTGHPDGVLLEGERLSPGGFHCFEHRWAVTAAVEYFEQIGKDAVFARIRELSDSLKRGLKTIAGVRVITPQSCEFSAGLVCFEIAGHGSHVVCSELEKRRILCSPAPYKKSFCRFSPFIYNSMDDIFKAIEAVREVSAQLCRKV